MAPFRGRTALGAGEVVAARGAPSAQKREIVSSANPINIRMDSAAASTRAQNVRAATPISSEGAMLSER